ncbi:sensor histidine kinase [Alteribacillus iranensis]|uniref:histidine kinase n=1 Tax=Alteribacillus iranensis TaxID=930128 RepID=A0A1I2CPJ2_9BACI|nr:two-component system, NarL family, sensor histidine kinase DesK [Alteribacillus iranensis]
MKNWFHIIPKNTGLSSYIWVIFCILPFYFIFKSSSIIEILFGITMIFLFFGSYRLSFISEGWPVYIWVSIKMAINMVMTILFGYVYFALFLAFFIGKIQRKIGFWVLYAIHIVSTSLTIVVSVLRDQSLIMSQLPFIVITVLGVVMLPLSIHNRIKREVLEDKLEDANEKISQMMVMEERQRIARDLHDTLGQKLSLIGLKSDLAGKLIEKNPENAKEEIKDIHQTARTALKEVREMVSDMKGTTIKDEVIRVTQLLTAANIEVDMKGTPHLTDTPLLVENVLSMCLKEAVTNIVKHSEASKCDIYMKESEDEVIMEIKDNGKKVDRDIVKGNGLRGMDERLEFVNGSLTIEVTNGMSLTIQVPKVIQQVTKEEFL